MLFKPQYRYYAQLMRLEKPIGWLLLLWPCYWALWLAGDGFPGYRLLIIFSLGVLLMRAAGCVINDIADRRIDPQVTRTRLRPLAQQAISTKSALWLFLLLLALAASLLIWLNNLVKLLAICAALNAIIYPFCKRFFALPQLVLGFAFSWSVPMAYAEQQGQLPTNCWLLFSIAVIWPLIYDSFYAMIDQEDDRKLNLHSSALSFGRYTSVITGALQLLFIGLFAWLGLRLALGYFFYAALLIAALLFGYQQRLIASGNRANYFKAFKNNNWLGLIIFLGIVMHALY